MKRSIILFPAFDNLDLLDAIRRDHDPLFGYIAPHVTLVFPFASDLTGQEVQRHLEKAIAECSAFEASFRSFSGDYRDGYIFLDCVKGNDAIIGLHDLLYSGPLKDEIFNEVPYFPHITVGKVAEPSLFSKIVRELNEMHVTFTCWIDRVYVEQIGEDEQSIVESSWELKPI